MISAGNGVEPVDVVMDGEEKVVKEEGTEDVVMAEGAQAGVEAGDLAESSMSR